MPEYKIILGFRVNFPSSISVSFPLFRRGKCWVVAAIIWDEHIWISPVGDLRRYQERSTIRDLGRKISHRIGGC